MGTQTGESFKFDLINRSTVRSRRTRRKRNERTRKRKRQKHRDNIIPPRRSPFVF